MAATMKNVDEIRNRVILGEFGVKNVSHFLTVVFITCSTCSTSACDGQLVYKAPMLPCYPFDTS